MIQNSDIAIAKVLPLLEKIKVSPSKAVINDALMELKLIKDYMAKINGHGDDPSIRNLLSQLTHFMAVQLDRNEFVQSRELTKIVFGFIVQVGEFEDVRHLLREEFSFLKYISLFFRMPLSESERIALMAVAEVLTRDVCIPWKAPCFVDLINYTLEGLTNHPNEDDILELSLQILVNLCSSNHSCILILRGCENYKNVWKLVKNKVITTNDYLATMIMHLSLLTEVYTPSDIFSSLYETAKACLTGALKQHRKTDYFNKLMQSVRQMVLSVCRKMRSTWCDDSIKAGSKTSNGERSAAAKYALLEFVTTLQEDIHKFVNESRDKLQDEIKESILLTVTALMHPFTLSSTEPTLLRNCMAAAEITRRILTCSQKPRLLLLTYRAILRVCELIYQNKEIPEDKTQEFMSLFKDVVRGLKLDGEMPLIGLNLDMSIVNLRLFSLLLVDSQVRESVKQKLLGNTVLALLNKTSNDTVDQSLKFRHSVFIVELLNVVRNVFGSDDLDNYLLSPGVVNHVCNCLRTGDENEISRTLRVINSAGSSGVQLISRSLRLSQELMASSGMHLDTVSEEKNLSRDRLELEMTSSFVDNQKNSDSPVASDLVAWCQIRREVHRQEIGMLNNHIVQLNRTNANLNALLEKQNTFIARHISATEQRDTEISTLQHRYEDAVKTSEIQVKQLENDSATLRKDCLELSQANKAMDATIKTMQIKIDELISAKKTLEDNNSTLNVELSQTKEEVKSLTKKYNKTNQLLESAHSKNSKLEDDVKLKENELDELHNNIKQRQVQLDAIQSILGPQFVAKFEKM